MPDLLAIAEYVTRVHAICVSCGVAQFSNRTISETSRSCGQLKIQLWACFTNTEIETQYNFENFRTLLIEPFMAKILMGLLMKWCMTQDSFNQVRQSIFALNGKFRKRNDFISDAYKNGVRFLLSVRPKVKKM